MQFTTYHGLWLSLLVVGYGVLNLKWFFPKIVLLFFVALALGCDRESANSMGSSTDPPVADPPTPPLSDNVEIQKLVSDLTSAFGPAYHPIEDRLIWSTVDSNNSLEDKIQFYDFASGSVQTWITDAKASRGNFVDSMGAIVSLEGRFAARVVSRDNTNTAGAGTVLSDRWEGQRFSSLGDLDVLPDGTIYFTDSGEYNEPSGLMEVPFLGLWRRTIQGTTEPVLDSLPQPRGVVFAPNLSVFYVSEASQNKIYEYRINDFGAVTRERLFATHPADESPVGGVTTDVEGNLYATGGQFLRIYSPVGVLLHELDLAEPSTDLTFGGADKKTLFITTQHSIFFLRGNVPGR